MENKESFNSFIKDDKDDDREFQQLVNTHEHLRNWDGLTLIKYKGFNLPLIFFEKIISCEQRFKARDEDIIIATYPKSGTTWLKALTFSVANRNTYDPTDPNHPLLSKNPHELVRSLEFDASFDDSEDSTVQECPRIFGTHIPYSVFPDSVRESKCKLIYICRNPLDQLVSYNYFSRTNFARDENAPLRTNEAFDLLCEGRDFYGPFWDHVTGYWKAHIENPNKVLFMKYEELKEDTLLFVRKIAEFIGRPFSPEEEGKGVAKSITRLCSFENLSNLEVNISGGNDIAKFSSLFRKGEVGDWRNYITPQMAERVQKILDIKFEGLGLNFNFLA